MKTTLPFQTILMTILMAFTLLGGNIVSAQSFAYVINISSNDISIIDTTTNTVVSTVGVGSQPHAVAITPDGSHAYVAHSGSNSSISVIDTTSNTVVATVIACCSPEGVAITPDGSHAYVANTNANEILVVDTTTNTVVSTVGVGNSPRWVAITPDGSHAYVANINSNNISVIDTTTNTVVSTVGVGNGPFGVAITPDGSRAYVANFFSNNVSIIDTASNMVVSTVGVGSEPAKVAITPDGSRAYVANINSNNVSVIDTTTNTVVSTVGVGHNPRSVAITPDGSHVYIANFRSDNISVIDTTTNTVVATVVVGDGPIGVAIIPESNKKPVAYAGADQAIILLNTEVQLDGTGSYDEDGDAITYAWNITQKPAGSSAVLSSTTSATPTFTPDVYGDYVIELTVSDPTETGSTDSVTISFDNVKPVANAGGNKSLLVGDTAVLDGTGSTDANGDPLTYSWSFVSKPVGSTATLSGSTNPTTSFVADVSGTYDVNLTVNDGLLDSDPDTANILAITVVNAITQLLNDTMDAINNIPPADLKNPNMANALTNKINAVLKMIEKEQYQGALNKLTNDILTKTDGCAISGNPDKTDWIITCAEQDVVYGLIMEAIGIVNSQL